MATGNIYILALATAMAVLGVAYGAALAAPPACKWHLDDRTCTINNDFTLGLKGASNPVDGYAQTVANATSNCWRHADNDTACSADTANVCVFYPDRCMQANVTDSADVSPTCLAYTNATACNADVANNCTYVLGAGCNTVAPLMWLDMCAEMVFDNVANKTYAAGFPTAQCEVANVICGPCAAAATQQQCQSIAHCQWYPAASVNETSLCWINYNVISSRTLYAAFRAMGSQYADRLEAQSVACRKLDGNKAACQAAVLGATTATIDGNAYPFCVNPAASTSAVSDSQGRKWSYENGSCVVVATPAPAAAVDGKYYPVCANASAATTIDSQGRKWGWENSVSCLAAAKPATPGVVSAPVPSPSPAPVAPAPGNCTKTVAVWEKCGGKNPDLSGGNYTAAGVCCAAGNSCYYINEWYWQCRPAGSVPATVHSPRTTVIDQTTFYVCANPSGATTIDKQGRRWGWENGASCVVVG